MTRVKNNRILGVGDLSIAPNLWVFTEENASPELVHQAAQMDLNSTHQSVGRLFKHWLCCVPLSSSSESMAPLSTLGEQHLGKQKGPTDGFVLPPGIQ